MVCGKTNLHPIIAGSGTLWIDGEGQKASINSRILSFRIVLYEISAMCFGNVQIWTESSATRLTSWSIISCRQHPWLSDYREGSSVCYISHVYVSIVHIRAPFVNRLAIFHPHEGKNAECVRKNKKPSIRLCGTPVTWTKNKYISILLVTGDNDISMANLVSADVRRPQVRV